MTEPLNVEQTAARLREADPVLILCHKNPDGDTIGCGSALYYALTALGKTAAVLCADPVPRRLSFAKPRLFRGEFEPQLVVAVDVAGVQLFGDTGLMPAYSRRVDLCIDHHAGNNGYAQYTLLDDAAAATAELLCDVIEAMGVQLDAQMADCLYTGLATDTGCFRFANTTAKNPPGGRPPDRGGGPGGGAEHPAVLHQDPGPDRGGTDGPEPSGVRPGGPVRPDLAEPG